MDAVITTEDLRKSFRVRKATVEAVKGVSFEVGRGENLRFLGPNGAGKTTTLRMLTTLLSIDSGTASVVRLRRRDRAEAGASNGSATSASGRRRRPVDGLGEPDPPGPPLRRRSRHRAPAGQGARRRARPHWNSPIGRSRPFRVASAGVSTSPSGLFTNPRVLFLDEPTTGLDPQNRANLWDHIRVIRERGSTVFLTTHYLEEADALCDRLTIMDHGSIVAEGTPRELKREVVGDSVVLGLVDDGLVERASALLRTEPFIREIVLRTAGCVSTWRTAAPRCPSFSDCSMGADRAEVNQPLGAHVG